MQQRLDKSGDQWGTLLSIVKKLSFFISISSTLITLRILGAISLLKIFAKTFVTRPKNMHNSRDHSNTSTQSLDYVIFELAH